ncbi:Fic/DOC family protein [Aeromonas caviae]|uniref:Fic/DOC family protein n=1 Tax=Aeromonas caviae TaxID=648 RepID=UPI002B48F872|nr:Fic family protein [Aeromonas caviae]
MDKYGSDQDPYCYEGTKILINKLHIMDEEILDQAEAEFSLLGINNINFNNPPYDFEYLSNIHKLIFGEIYPWAGSVRTIDISKGNSRFCNTVRIIPEVNKFLKKINSEGCLGNLDHNVFVSKIAEYYADLNAIHPFREGNGRAQRVLFEHIALCNGYLIRWDLVTKKEWVLANIYGMYYDFTHLEVIFSKCLIKL